ncbi:MAG: hypothetical protein ACR2J8_05760, partial [Thermomicrobiales bacterium]
MDQQAVDHIAAVLGSAASRRAGLASALSVALGRGATAASASRPRRQGPCGDFSRAANRCRKHGDCCTEICDTTLKNIDRDGRCRCRRRGQPCE